MMKAQERNVVGNKGKVDEDDLPKLTYLKAVIKEVMRLYHPAHLLLPRETIKETILHRYKIKPKTLVFVNAWTIGRYPESWENPEEFLPKRFLGSNMNVKGNNFKLISFGAGIRICPGMLMVIVTVELFLANVLYLINWGLLDGMKNEDIDFEVKPGLTTHKKLTSICLSDYVAQISTL